jgi:serine/threonine protein phosphatase PrpC
MYNTEDSSYTVSLGVSSLIGTRPNQQDSVYAEILEDSLVAILCDGMGGLESGEIASQTAIQTFAEDYEKRDKTMDIPNFLKQEAIEMDTVIAELTNDAGEPIKAGSTVAAVVIQHGLLYWLSVGDSRIYVIRGEEMMAVNRDHNYLLRLKQALQDGEITQEIYEQESQSRNAEALISFLGIGNLTLMDINRRPLELRSGDVVLVCSDGLYRTLSEDTIRTICLEHLPNPQKAADVLTESAILASLESQDNTSVVVAHIM